MKTVKRTICILTVLIITVFAASCVSTGEYMLLNDGETVIGTVQSSFAYRTSFFSMKKIQKGVNTQAYIQLLTAAEKKYSGGIDIRDIMWVTGRSIDGQNTEISATGKVIRIDEETR